MRQRHYEALFILKAVGTDQDMLKSVSRLEEPIKKLGGKIEQTQTIGRRRLAFRIARQQEGHYHLVRFTAQTDCIVELKRLLHLEESILRFLILSEDEQLAGASAASGERRPLRKAMAVPRVSSTVPTASEARGASSVAPFYEKPSSQ